PRQLIVYPFMELYRDRNMEYKPSDFGFGYGGDLRGRYRATERLLFIGYGISDRLEVEFEIGHISATLDRSPSDPSKMPAVTRQSGLGDVEGQLRYRWLTESATRPEVYSFTELVLPHARSKALIGTPSLEYALGAGAIKGFSFGTLNLEIGGERSGSSVDPIYALGYTRRLNDRFRIYTGVEGNQDEVEWIQEVQIRLNRNVTLKLNNSFGLTS